MNRQDYHSTLEVPVSPGEAFEKISQVSDWWAPNFEGDATNLNDVFTVHFGKTWVRFKIIDMIPGSKICWEVIDCNLDWLNDKKEWKGTKAVWDLKNSNGSTRIDFTHVGLIPEIECFDQCSSGWKFYISQSLLKLITDGKGLPGTPQEAR